MTAKMPAGLALAAAFSLALPALARAQNPSESLPNPKPLRTASVARLANVDELRQRFGLAAYDNLPVETLKIAVLDYGFDRIDGVRRYLPEGAVLVEHYDPEFVRRFKLGDPEYRKSFAPLNPHGRMMAQIIWAVTGFNPRGPKFYLLNANGPTMLRRAVRYAIEAKVDIILFCGTFEGGGNGDGRGPINRVVADAVAAGILWINAAGNYGGHVYNGPVEVLPSGYLRLGKGSDETALRFRNLLDENTVTITLTWNDYREEEDAGTDKDLDLYVEDWLGWVAGSSEKKQITGAGKNDPEESRNPRERIVLTDLAADREHDYLIRIKAKSGKFTPDDRLRVVITSSREGFLDPKTGAPTEAIQFLDASHKGEMYPPADNPLVLTVGDSSPNSSAGPTADYRRKPDIILEDSNAAFTNGDLTAGASNAAAYFAGIVALMKAAEPGLSTRHLLWFAHHDKATSVALDTSDTSLGITPRAIQRRLPTTDRLRQAIESMSAPTGTQYYYSTSTGIPRYYSAPTQVRPADVRLYGTPRSATDASAISQSPKVTGARQAEVLKVPPKEVGVRPVTPMLIWRTPTREHLTEVVHEGQSK
ncbi:MAG TPA: S8 family serine peptidase [Gemmataceae bacterium]|nr:S8 family serine peptidase [Gemmataceae bacterium]